MKRALHGLWTWRDEWVFSGGIPAIRKKNDRPLRSAAVGQGFCDTCQAKANLCQGVHKGVDVFSRVVTE